LGGIDIIVLRVEFLLKTDSGYPRDAGIYYEKKLSIKKGLSIDSIVFYYVSVA